MTKIVALLLLCAVVACGFAPLTAHAEAEFTWARITKNDVYLYADDQCQRALFRLEKTYYVEVLETLDNVYLVAVMQNQAGFPSLMGYARKIELTPVQATPITPLYPTEQITVTGDSAQLKLLPTSSSENVIVATTSQRLSYYGELTYYGKDWYYVYCAGKFGYVEQSAVSRPNIQPHPTPLQTVPVTSTPQTPDDGNNDNPTEKAKTPTAEILLIVFVVLLAGGLTLALFLPGNGRKADIFEQDI